MPLEPLSPAAFAFIAQIDRAYARLMQFANLKAEASLRKIGSGGFRPGEFSAGEFSPEGFRPEFSSREEFRPEEASLAGQLLYAGELNDAGRALACAANIAGAATLAVSADQATRKQAMRDGIVDFLVTSLDEALRILKNQVRKRETAAVCVGAAPEAVEREIEERGVLPDLVSSAAAPRFAPQFANRPTRAPRVIDPTEAGAEEGVWLSWRAAAAPPLWLPKLDAIALACLPPDAEPARRWLNQAPRYLGRLTQSARVLRAGREFVDEFIAQLKQHIASGQITVPVEIELGPWGQSELHQLGSPESQSHRPNSPGGREQE